MIANLPEKTGRALEEWLNAVRASGHEKHGQIVGMLKERGVSHGYANLIAHIARGNVAIPGEPPGGAGGAGAPGSGAGGSGAGARDASAAGGAAPADPVAAQYEGKEALRPLYDAIVAAVRKFGDDVELAPKKTYVSLRRAKQFGLLQPSTKTRLDVGIKLKDADPTPRLEAAGSWNAMVTHRVRVTASEEVDDELVQWLRGAYDAAS